MEVLVGKFRTDRTLLSCEEYEEKRICPQPLSRKAVEEELLSELVPAFLLLIESPPRVDHGGNEKERKDFPL